MSPRGMSEQVCVLRETIARIEGDGSIATTFGKCPAVDRVSLGCGRAMDHGLTLDRVLGGGLRRGGLSEVVAGAPGDAGAASGFALALAARFATASSNGAASGAAEPVVWILEKGARAETGVPYAPGLAAHGLDPARLIVVRTLNGAESLWAMEEALKCRAVAAVVLDLWRTRSYDLVASRRLVLAAGASGTPGILVTAGAAGTARTLCSAAQTRFEVAAAPGPHVRVDTGMPAGMRLPLPGRAAWSVRLARIRAGRVARRMASIGKSSGRSSGITKRHGFVTRYLSLHLPFLATDRIRRREMSCSSLRMRREPDTARRESRAASRLPDPDPPQGPMATVAKVKSSTRLIALDARALAIGLKPMTALADARAMHPNLVLHEADPEGDAVTLAGLVDWCRLFTPLAALDGADGAILDVTGAAHLFGGETALIETMIARLAEQGFAAALAMAGSPGAAWALARYGGGRRLIEAKLDAADVAKVFAPMPIAALRLDERVVGQLGQAGLRRVGDLLLRPRAPIAARFGRDIHRRLDALLGSVREAISPRFETPAFVAERRFAEGIARHEDVEATILALSYDLCGLLARHGEGARLLDVSLFRVDGVVKHLEAGTSRPLRDPLAMARLFRERIAAAGEDGLETGYGFEVVRLAALGAERLDETQPNWDLAGTPQTADLADLVDRLGARFGLDRVARLQLADAHQPEKAAVAVPAATSAAKRIRTAAVASVSTQDEEREALPERPIRLLERPEPIQAVAAVPDGPPLRFRWRRVLHQVAAIEGPERIGPDWWAQGAGRETGLSSATRDYFRAEDEEGRRFWLYREGLYRETPEPRWFLHGFFA